MDLENMPHGVYHLVEVSSHGGYQRQPSKSFHLGEVNSHAVLSAKGLH